MIIICLLDNEILIRCFNDNKVVGLYFGDLMKFDIGFNGVDFIYFV